MHRFPLLLSALTLILGPTPYAGAQEPSPPTTDEQVIRPQLERRDVKIPEIDTEDFELGIFSGLYAVDDFATNPVYGMQLIYHATEDVFLEIAGGITKVDDSAFRRIGLNVFREENEELSYYQVSAGFNLLPGEFYWLNRRSYTAALFVIGGVGTTRLADDDRFTFSYGSGVRLLATDWLTVRLELRDHVYDSDLLGTNERKHNVEGRIGLATLF